MPDLSESTAAAILSAAHSLFLRRGYSGTSMRAIAAEAGIALGGIYNHFDGKEDIFREVILGFHPYREILPAIANAHFQTPEELFRGAARLVDTALKDRPDVFNLMFIEIVEFNSRHLPDLLERILPEMARSFQQLNNSSAQLRAIPMPMVWRIFIGTILGYYISNQAIGPDIPPEFSENALDHFMEVFLHGILKPEAGP